MQRQDDLCPGEPYAAVLVFEDAFGAEVARTTSGADGRYSQALPPGSYTVVPQTPLNNILPIAGEVMVMVKAGEWLTLDISYDTGIR